MDPILPKGFVWGGLLLILGYIIYIDHYVNVINEKNPKSPPSLMCIPHVLSY